MFEQCTCTEYVPPQSQLTVKAEPGIDIVPLSTSSDPSSLQIIVANENIMTEPYALRKYSS